MEEIKMETTQRNFLYKSYYNKGIRTNLTFGQAIDMLRALASDTGSGDNYGMRLPNWKEDVVIYIQLPDKDSKMTAPYLYVESRFGRVPWKETNIELFSEDWTVVERVVTKTKECKKEEPCSPNCTKRCLNECNKNTKNSFDNELERFAYIIDKVFNNL